MAEQAGRREAAGGEAEEPGSGARAHAERSLNQALRRGQHLVCDTAPPPSPPEGRYRGINGGGLFVRRECSMGATITVVQSPIHRCGELRSRSEEHTSELQSLMRISD